MSKRAATDSAKNKGSNKKKKPEVVTIKQVGEMKYFDTALTGSALPASADWTGTEYDPATFLTLCVPQVGAAINQRIGKAINVHKIKIHGSLIIPTQNGGNPAQDAIEVRLLLVQDMQTNAAQMQGEQVMTPTATAQAAINVFQNIDNFGRFRVLKDKMLVIQDPNIDINSATATAYVNGKVLKFKFTQIFSKPVQVRFNGTNGGTIADIIDNSFHIIANCSSIDGAPTISYVSRVCYKE